jgi:hypothetical protein
MRLRNFPADLGCCRLVYNLCLDQLAEHARLVAFVWLSRRPNDHDDDA